MVIKETRSDKIFNFINYFLLACVFLICLYPLWFIIIASISNPDLVNGARYGSGPRIFPLTAIRACSPTTA